MHLRYLARCALLILVATSTSATAATYYVDISSGNDSNSGTSSAEPFKTIKKAAKVINSGDTVNVYPGVYSDDVFVHRVQQSTLPAQFVAIGDVFITGKFKVVHSNYVQLDGFVFQNVPGKVLVWRGAYEGLVDNCVFNAGSNSLLIKDGSLTIDNCQILDFSSAGIEVDGEADVTIRNSTISGCQDAGLAIRKTSRVTVENCLVTNNLGDGLEVAVTEIAIDDGVDESQLSNGVPPLAVSDGPVSFGGKNSIDGDFHHSPGVSVDPAHVTGTVHELSSNALLPVDPGSAATDNDNSNVPLTDKGNNPLDGNGNFFLSGSDGIDLPPGTYYFNNLTASSRSEIRISGPTIIYTAGAVELKGVSNPAQDPSLLQLYSMGASVSIEAQADIYAAIYAPSASVSVTGRATVAGMLVSGSLTMGGSATFHPDESLSDLALSLVASPPSSPSPPAEWEPVVSGELVITGSEVNNNANGVRMETAQHVTLQQTQLADNISWGLTLLGNCQLSTVSVSSSGAGGLQLTNMSDGEVQFSDVTLTNNGDYGVYANECQLTFSATQNWTNTGSNHAYACTNTTLALDGLTISGGTTAGAYCYQGSLTVENCAVSNNGYGVSAVNSSLSLNNCSLSQNAVGIYSNDNAAATVLNCTIQGNTAWAAVIHASSDPGASTTLNNCIVSGNAGGITVTGAEDGDFNLLDTTISDNSQTGLHFVNCSMTINDQATANWSTLRNLHGMSLSQSTIVLDGVVITESASYGIHTDASSLTIHNATVTGRDGIYSTGNGSLTVRATRLLSTASGVSNWGIYRTQGACEITNCVVGGFRNGIYLDTPTATELAVVTHCTIVNSAGSGIVVDNGDTVVTNTIVAGSGGSLGMVRNGGQLLHTYNLVHGFSTLLSGTPVDPTEILKTPRFADAASGDFQLGIGSPAINAGEDLTSQVSTDLLGNPRPSFGAVEMGAYEFMDDNGSFRILNWAETAD